MPIKAVLFDFMGTCLDWHSSIISTLPADIPETVRSDFALTWRQTYFDTNSARVASNLPVQDIDITHTNTLEAMLEKPEYAAYKSLFTPAVKADLITAWHRQPAWPDVAPAIEKLRKRGLEVFVHANGTTRLQLDLCKFAGLRFDMLFSSYLLGVYKPARENYTKMLEMIQRRPEECVTVAAHAYDTRGAKNVGMKTVYIYRWTDDVNEDQGEIKKDHDVWLDGMSGLDEAIASL